jgi:hypothetical protein
LTQHSDELNTKDADGTTPATDHTAAGEENQTVLGVPALRAMRFLVSLVIGLIVINAAVDWISKGRIDLEMLIIRTSLVASLASLFLVKRVPEPENYYLEPFTSDASELPRLFKRAIAFRAVSPEDESVDLGVWNALSYLSKKLEPQHKTVFTEDALGDLKGFLASETRRDRLETLLRIAAIAADPELLPLLRDLKDRTKDLDVLDNLRVALRDAISSCAKFA